LEDVTSVFRFFDDIFGDGTARKIFGSKTNLNACLNAVDELVSDADQQYAKVEERMHKYSPNRAVRRATK